MNINTCLKSVAAKAATAATVPTPLKWEIKIVHLQFLRSKSLSELSNDLIPLLNWEMKIDLPSFDNQKKNEHQFLIFKFSISFFPMQRLTHYCCQSNTSLDWTIARMWQCIMDYIRS